MAFLHPIPVRHEDASIELSKPRGLFGIFMRSVHHFGEFGQLMPKLSFFSDKLY
jgi:hypothetical protein